MFNRNRFALALALLLGAGPAFAQGQSSALGRHSEEGRPFVLEANPNPNLAYGEDFAESAEVHGISYERLLDRILTLGLRWEPERTG